MSFRSLPHLSLKLACILLLSSAFIHRTEGSVGVVDINDLLEPGSQQYLSSQKAGAGGNAAWTHRPNCTHSTSFSKLGAKYCVYTNSNAFFNGISIITTPTVAQDAIQYLNEEPEPYFLSDKQLEKFFTKPRAYEIVDLPGKDKGVVATRKIKKYETFMVDQASLVMDLEMEKAVSKKDNLRLLKLGIDRLRDPEVVRGLSGKHNGEKGENDDEDVMMTNAFGTQVGETNFRGLFPLVSRINHACNPNAFVMFSQSGLSIGIKAYRDIEKGEEISISYLLLGMTSAKRQEGLKRWGFKCSCSLCSATDAEKAASDARRKRIEEAEPQLVAHWKEGKYQAAIRIGEEVVKLMKEEDLTPMLTDEYVILARLYLIRGDREMAEEYADLAVEILENLGFLGTETREDWNLERLLGYFADRGLYQGETRQAAKDA